MLNALQQCQGAHQVIKTEDSVAPPSITLTVVGQKVYFSIKYSGRKKGREAVSGIMHCWPV